MTRRDSQQRPWWPPRWWLAWHCPFWHSARPAPGAAEAAARRAALACAPTLTYEAPPTPLRVTGGQDSFVHRIFAPGDLVTINAGTRQRHRGRPGVLHPPRRADRAAGHQPRQPGDDPDDRLDSHLGGGRRDVARHDHARLRHDRVERLPRAVRAAGGAGGLGDRPKAERGNYGRVHDGQRPPHAASGRATTSSSTAAATTASRAARSSSSIATSGSRRISCSSSVRPWRWT